MNIYDEVIKELNHELSVGNIGIITRDNIATALERAKKEHELLGLYKELGGIEQDIEYLCGLRDCMIEHSVEKPMEHIYSGIKEYKEKRDGLNYQIKQLEEELK